MLKHHIGSTPATEIHNAEVLGAIPFGVKKILEVGTGSGALAREIRREFPDVEYVGVEISEQYCGAAQSWCTRVYLENFENASEKLTAELITTDVVIFADVLEHFLDPWRVLAFVRNGLPAHGSVIACIPNVQHWSVQCRLLVGDFRYADSGLLDRTHLRFFTRQTITEMFVNCGYRVDRMTPRIFAFPQQETMLDKISKVSQIWGVDPQIAVIDAAAFQFVVTATLLHE
jgi:2-polyprenyl-3-methyl-5-hydroxy-6-metoxy-1,4-benzoquinol methylase